MSFAPGEERTQHCWWLADIMRGAHVRNPATMV
jgi:hypothetical protein